MRRTSPVALTRARGDAIMIRQPGVRRNLRLSLSPCTSRLASRTNARGASDGMHARPSALSNTLRQATNRMSARSLWCQHLHATCTDSTCLYVLVRHPMMLMIAMRKMTHEMDIDDMHPRVEVGLLGLTHARVHAHECVHILACPVSSSRVAPSARGENVTKVVVDIVCMPRLASVSKVCHLSIARLIPCSQVPAGPHAHTCTLMHTYTRT